MPEVDFVVQGAGIAGAALTRFLKSSGFSVLTVDSRESIKPEGAGILLQENALLALSHLGIRIADLPTFQSVESINVGSLQHPKAVSISGADSAIGLPRHNLLSALHAGLDSDCVQMGKTILSWHQDSDKNCHVQLNDGQQWRCRCIVACDGARSALREAVQESKIAFRDTRQFCWRLILDNIDHDRSAYEFQEGRFRLGVIPTGERQVYAYLTEANIDPDIAFEKSWQDVKAAINSFGAFGEAVGQGIHSGTRVLKHPLLDAPVYMPARSDVLFIGDAAHPMTPNMGQGAAMALEDAVILGCLLRRNDPGKASRLFRKIRRGRVVRLRSLSYMAGSLAHIASPTLRYLRGLGMRSTPAVLIRSQQRLFSNAFQRQLIKAQTLG